MTCDRDWVMSGHRWPLLPAGWRARRMRVPQQDADRLRPQFKITPGSGLKAGLAENLSPMPNPTVGADASGRGSCQPVAGRISECRD